MRVVVPVRRRASLALDDGADVTTSGREGEPIGRGCRARGGGDVELGGRAARCAASNGRGLDAIVAGPPADGEEPGASVPPRRGLGSPAKRARKARRGGHRRRGARLRAALVVVELGEVRDEGGVSRAAEAGPAGRFEIVLDDEAVSLRFQADGYLETVVAVDPSTAEGTALEVRLFPQIFAETVEIVSEMAIQERLSATPVTPEAVFRRRAASTTSSAPSTPSPEWRRPTTSAAASRCAAAPPTRT